MFLSHRSIGVGFFSSENENSSCDKLLSQTKPQSFHYVDLPLINAMLILYKDLRLAIRLKKSTKSAFQTCDIPISKDGRHNILEVFFLLELASS